MVARGWAFGVRVIVTCWRWTPSGCPSPLACSSGTGSATSAPRTSKPRRGLAETRIRMILMNPLYNGWIRRHRGQDETRRPAPWRSDPPVSDELWARVEEIRRAKTRGGGAKNWARVDLLGACSNASAVVACGTTAPSPTVATASSTRTRARHGDARPDSAMKRGKCPCWPRSRASRSTMSRWRQLSPRSAPATSRSPSTGRGSIARSANWPWSTPLRGSLTTPTWRE